MTRQRFILAVVVVAIPVLAWLAVPTVKHWLAPSSVVDVHRLRLGMTADEVRGGALDDGVQADGRCLEDFESVERFNARGRRASGFADGVKKPPPEHDVIHKI